MESVSTPAEPIDAMNDDEIPRWETHANGIQAICEPDGYCKDEHRCGRLDLGIRRDSTLNTTNDFIMFTEQFAAIADRRDPDEKETAMSETANFIEPCGSMRATEEYEGEQ